jgi:SAM-dependent methyltransferase
MAIGSCFALYSRTRIGQIVNRFVGVSDLHTHLRIGPVVDWMRKSRLTAPAVLELGCGPGLTLFEIAQRFPGAHARGFDLNPDVIARATAVKARLFPAADIQFEAVDLSAAPELAGGFDLVLLLDFLEHVPDPRAIVEAVRAVVRPCGYVLVSVPTPAYPRYFGRAFHEEMGHLVDGYSLGELQQLLTGFELIEHRYSTGFVARYFCALFYRLRGPVRLRLAAMYALHLARALDVGNSAGTSCSLFAVFRPTNAKCNDTAPTPPT